VVFADVELQAGDNAVRLEADGLPIIGSRSPRGGAGRPKSGNRKLKFLQPCAAFDGCRCRIYAERPSYCREFECLLLKNVNERRTQLADALDLIHKARQQADSVRRLLRLLGDSDEVLALSARFRRTAKRMEETGGDQAAADLYGELTLAVHDLNLILSEAFYPAT
jgi:uncharacterized protein